MTVDWGGGSRAMYDQAAVNARVAGLEIAYLINWLEKHLNHHPRDVHVIGHSLGAHVAGLHAVFCTGECFRSYGFICCGYFFSFFFSCVVCDFRDRYLFLEVYTCCFVVTERSYCSFTYSMLIYNNYFFL